MVMAVLVAVLVHSQLMLLRAVLAVLVVLVKKVRVILIQAILRQV
jgi:hypothetical protein